MGESAIPCAHHAIIGGSEASFVELVSHADGRSSIVIYTVDGGRRLYATEVEWRQGATLLVQQIEAQAAERQITGAQRLVTSKSSAKDKLSLFRSLFVGRGDLYAHGYRKRSGGIGPPVPTSGSQASVPRGPTPTPGVRTARSAPSFHSPTKRS